MADEIFVLGVSSSSRKEGSTATLLKKVIESAEEQGAKTEILYLFDKDIKPCLSCLAEQGCTYPCIIKDDMPEIYELIRKADCLVLASPTYWFDMSGLMKNFLERLTALFHLDPPALDGKVAGFVSSGDTEGSSVTIRQMMMALCFCGATLAPYPYVYENVGKGATRSVLTDEFRETIFAKRLGRNLVRMAKLVKHTQGTWDGSYKRFLPK